MEDLLTSCTAWPDVARLRAFAAAQATRARREAEAKIPAVAVRVGHGDVYYMLHAFNHHNQHAQTGRSGVFVIWCQ